MIFSVAKRSYCCAALVAPLMVLAGCTTSTNYVDYKERALYSSNTVGGMEYVEVGPVVSKSAGFIWESCEKLQAEALDELHQKRAERGANSVFDVRWVNHSEGTLSDTPICTTGWGWFVPGLLPGFGPWVKATEVRGKMAYINEEKRLSIGADSDDYAGEAGATQNQEESKSVEEKTDGSDESAQSDTSDLTTEAFGDEETGLTEEGDESADTAETAPAGDNGDADSGDNATEAEQVDEDEVDEDEEESASDAQQN